MIIIRIYEGLGNQLFQYAYAKALSLSTKQPVLLDIRETGKHKSEVNLTYREYSLNHYKISLPVCSNVQHFYPFLNKSDELLEIIQKLSVKSYLPYKFFRESTSEYQQNLANIKGNWYLQGWFQDSRYFQGYEQIIKKEIRPRKGIKISSDLKRILQEENTVSVHIRRGDYKRLSNILPIQYYYNAMKHVRDLVDNPFWVVFSDEIEWVKENIKFENRSYFLDKRENLKDYEELMVMRCCKNHIIANSTFSWWGAWLGKNENKVVVAPDRWGLGQICNYGKNILPSDWIKEPIE